MRSDAPPIAAGTLPSSRSGDDATSPGARSTATSTGHWRIKTMLQLDRIRLAAVAALLLCGAAHVAARTPDGRAHANIPPRPSMPVVVPPEGAPVTSRNGTTLPPYNTTYYFDQLIDHSNPSLGTFQQRYWHTYEFYEKGRRRANPARRRPDRLTFVSGSQAAPSS